MLAPNPTRQNQKLLVSAKEAADMLSISGRKLWTLANRGDIPRIKIDRAVRYSVEDLSEYIDRQREATAR